MAFTAYRDNGYVGLSVQSAQGSAAAPSLFFKFTKGTAIKPDQKTVRYSDGNVRDVTNIAKTSFSYAGTFECLMYAVEAGALLAWAMGADSVSGSADPWTHALTFSDPLPYITVEVSRSDGQLIERIVDCKIAKLQIVAEIDKWVLMTITIVGTTATIPSAATVSFSDAATNGPAMMHQGAFTIVGSSDAAVLQAQVQKMTFDLDTGAKIQLGGGSLVPIGILEEKRIITCVWDCLFPGPTSYYLAYFGGTGGTAPSATVGAGSGTAKFTIAASPEHSILLTMNAWKIEDADVEGANQDSKATNIKIMTVLNRATSTLPATATVKNARSSAYI